MLHIPFALASLDFLTVAENLHDTGAQHRVQVVTDHKNLLYFSSTPTLNHRQARWSIFLVDYDFGITFRLGNQHSYHPSPGPSHTTDNSNVC